MTNELAPRRRRDVTFKELAAWARDDSHLLEREMLNSVREVVGQAGVKLKIAGLMLARRQLGQIQRMSELIEGDGGLESMLFDPMRRKHMKNGDLIQLYRIAATRHDQMTAAYIKGIMDPKTNLSPDPDDVRAALQTDDMLAEEHADLDRATSAALLPKLEALARRVTTREMGVVEPPPVVT